MAADPFLPDETTEIASKAIVEPEDTPGDIDLASEVLPTESQVQTIDQITVPRDVGNDEEKPVVAEDITHSQLNAARCAKFWVLHNLTLSNVEGEILLVFPS